MRIQVISDEEMKSIYDYVIEYFKKQDFEPHKRIEYRDDYQLLISAILLAGSRTPRDNITADILISTFPEPRRLAYASYDDVLKYTNGIRSPKKKAKYIMDTARELLKYYDGIVPETIDELQRFPGVGSTTARLIILTTCHERTRHTDTHAARVATRIGLAKEDSLPEEVEKEFSKYVPKGLLLMMNLWMTIHGRIVCLPDNPSCSKCGLKNICAHYNT
jgi:endonuclease-3